MAKAVPIVGAIAGAALGGPIGVGLLNAGIGLSAGAGIIAGQVAGAVVATAVNAVGSRALAKKPKGQQFTQEAQGRSVTIRSSVESHKIIYGRARVSGPLVYIGTSATGAAQATPNATNKMLHFALPLAGHEIEEVETVYFNDLPIRLSEGGQAIQAGPYFRDGKSYALVHKHLGGPDQLADPLMVADCPGWTANHRLREIAYLYVRFEWNPDVFPTGIPNVSATIKGKKLYDPRTGLSGWTDNAALCIRDYLTSRDGSAVDEPYGFGCDDSEIDDAHAIAAANACDELVAIAGGTQRRYTCNGVVDTATAPMENLQSLVTSLAGAVTYVQGRFRIHAAVYDAPVGAITDDMLAGPISTTLRVPRKDLFNAVKGTYVDPRKGWQPTDFPAVTNAAYEAQDGGERIAKDVELPFTTDPIMAQRLGKVLLEKGRQGITQTLGVDLSALKYSVYDVVTRTDPQHGWVDKPFRIMNLGIGVPGPIAMTLREESSDSYDWNLGEATATDAAPDTKLPDVTTVLPPGALTVTESLYVTRSGDGVKALATLDWVASSDAFLREYQAEYRARSESVWRNLPRTDALQSVIEDIAPGEYDFRVKAISNLGVSSEYSTASKQVAGLNAAPEEPQNLTVSTIGGLAILRWDEYRGNDSLDVRVGGHIVFRHSPDETAGWAQSTTIGNAVSGSATTAVLPLKPGVYLAKAVDSSGIESAAWAGVFTDQATALAYANVTSLTEDPAFTGAKANMAAGGGALKLAGAALVSQIPLIGAVPSIALSGGIRPGGTYDFSGAIDLGSVKRVRLTSHVLANIVNQLDTIRSRTAPVSTWKSITGTNAAEGDARVYVRTTGDDPAGSPSWGEYQRLDSGEHVCRGIQAQLRAESSDPAYNVVISELALTVDEVA